MAQIPTYYEPWSDKKPKLPRVISHNGRIHTLRYARIKTWKQADELALKIWKRPKTYSVKILKYRMGAGSIASGKIQYAVYAHTAKVN